MRFEVVAFVLGFFRSRAHAFPCGGHKYSHLIALAALRCKGIVTETQKIINALSLKAKRVLWRATARYEKVQRITLRLHFKKLPNSANFHEIGGFSLNGLHAVE